jgi:hypothetical protein
VLTNIYPASPTPYPSPCFSLPIFKPTCPRSCPYPTTTDHALFFPSQASPHVLNKKGEQVSTIEQAHRAHATAIESYDGPDPLTPWLAYLSWIKATFASGLTRILLGAYERCTRELAPLPQYADDIRYLRCWIQYADLLRDPLDVFLFLRDQNIGQGHALFYEAFAIFLERQVRTHRFTHVYSTVLYCKMHARF